jgi:hypothetical protein
MPSAYLQPSEYAAYGVPNATAAQVTQASALIDGYLSRNEGLIWQPDANGNPCYMSAMTPVTTLTATGGIAPGQNVNVTVTGGVQVAQPGFVAILDRGTPSLTEACIVNSITGNVVQLVNVQFSHSPGCLLEFGMVIFEEREMPTGRPLTVVSKTPVQMVLAGQGRYGYPRRGNSGVYAVNEYNLMAAITKFGGPPIWEIFNQTLVSINPNTGELWAPAGILLAYYTTIRYSYIAGYQYASLPSQIKQACANIITAINFLPMNGAIAMQRAGDTQIQRFAATYLDEDTKALLNPYCARLVI